MTEEKVEFPKWLYHPRHGGKIFKSKEETKWLWLKGWRDKPFAKIEDRKLGRMKAAWEENAWMFTALATVLGIAWLFIKIYEYVA